MFEPFAIPLLLFVAAVLYAAVGHGGASGYLAVMALFSISPTIMKPTALVLNILVSSIAFVQFYRAGHFSMPIFAPFALASIPFAYLGGSLKLPFLWYKSIVGVILLLSAIRLLYTTFGKTEQRQMRTLPLLWTLILGALLGFVSGLTGVGGGIFLSPLLIFLHLAETKQVSGISAAFIWTNSVAGLLGNGVSLAHFPPHFSGWIVAVLLGGVFGASFGAFSFDATWLRRILALVLVLAGGKMLLGG